MNYNCFYIFEPVNTWNYVHHIDNENDYCHKSANHLIKVKYGDIIFIFNEFVWFYGDHDRYQYIKIYNLTQNITSYISYTSLQLNNFRKL